MLSKYCYLQIESSELVLYFVVKAASHFLYRPRRSLQ